MIKTLLLSYYAYQIDFNAFQPLKKSNRLHITNVFFSMTVLIGLEFMFRNSIYPCMHTYMYKTGKLNKNWNINEIHQWKEIGHRINEYCWLGNITEWQGVHSLGLINQQHWILMIIWGALFHCYGLFSCTYLTYPLWLHWAKFSSSPWQSTLSSCITPDPSPKYAFSGTDTAPLNTKR